MDYLLPKDDQAWTISFRLSYVKKNQASTKNISTKSESSFNESKNHASQTGHDTPTLKTVFYAVFIVLCKNITLWSTRT